MSSPFLLGKKIYKSGWYYSFVLIIFMSVRSMVVYPLFPDMISKYQWIFTKHGMCIDIVEFWLGLLMGKFSQFFWEYRFKNVFRLSSESHLYNCAYMFCIVVIVMYYVLCNKILFKPIFDSCLPAPR